MFAFAFVVTGDQVAVQAAIALAQCLDFAAEDEILAGIGKVEQLGGNRHVVCAQPAQLGHDGGNA